MKKKEPLVSIIIPTYNAEKYIEETIKSVILQSYIKWEMIIVDDKSTDSTLNIIKSYANQDSRIKFIQLSQNSKGPAKPRNEGLKLAQGEYVAFLDADDIWIEDKLAIQVSYMTRHDKNFISSNMKLIDVNSNEIKNNSIINKFFKIFKTYQTKCDLIKHRFIVNSSVVVKKSLLGKFDEDKYAVEDFCMWLYLLNRPDIKYKYLDLELVKYRFLQVSVSSRNLPYKQDSQANLCISKHILKHNDNEAYKCYYSYIAKQYIKIKLKDILLGWRK